MREFRRNGISLLLIIWAAISLCCVSAFGEMESDEDQYFSISDYFDENEYGDPDEENLLYNGGFELMDEDGLPEGW